MVAALTVVYALTLHFRLGRFDVLSTVYLRRSPSVCSSASALRLHASWSRSSSVVIGLRLSVRVHTRVHRRPARRVLSAGEDTA